MRYGIRIALGLASLAIALPAPGQQAQEDSRESLRAAIEALKRQLARLESRLERLDSTSGDKAPSAGAVTSEPNAVTPVRAAKPRPGAEFDLYGFAQLDAIQDFARVNPDWEDSLRPTTIPTEKGEYGGDGRFIGSVRQTRFGLKATHATQYGDAFVNIEADLYGVGKNQGETALRLRHAYGQLGQLLAGQTNSLFMDGDVFPNIIDYWGPSGMALFRTVQLRWTPFSGKNSFAVAIESAKDAIDTGRFGRDFPDFGANAQGRDHYPDFSAQFRANRNWGHVQASALLRDIGFETANTPGNQPHGRSTGWGVALTSTINSFEQDRLILSALGGRGIANYMNDGGVDLIPDNSPPGVIPGPVAMPLWAGVLYYDRWWNSRWSSSAGYSFTQVSNTNNQTGDAFHKGEYASVNLLNHPAETVLVGAEFLWGKRTDHSGATGNDRRLQFSAKYSFSSKNP